MHLKDVSALSKIPGPGRIHTQASKDPIVQIGDSHASMNAHPVGQVVRFSTCENMNAPLFRLDEAVPTGMAMIVPRISATFCSQPVREVICSDPKVDIHTMKTLKLCIRPMIFERVDARTPWVRTVIMKTT